METEFRDAKGRFIDGNPGGPGRPKFSIVSILKEKLEHIPEGDKRRRIEILADQYLERVGQDGVAFRDLINRFDGEPKKSLEISGGETPVGLVIVRAGETSAHNSTSEAG